jgi:hypothetical protein
LISIGHYFLVQIPVSFTKGVDEVLQDVTTWISWAVVTKIGVVGWYEYTRGGHYISDGGQDMWPGCVQGHCSIHRYCIPKE